MHDTFDIRVMLPPFLLKGQIISPHLVPIYRVSPDAYLGFMQRMKPLRTVPLCQMVLRASSLFINYIMSYHCALASPCESRRPNNGCMLGWVYVAPLMPIQ
jgi:hypothetical protein